MRTREKLRKPLVKQCSFGSFRADRHLTSLGMSEMPRAARLTLLLALGRCVEFGPCELSVELDSATYRVRFDLGDEPRSVASAAAARRVVPVGCCARVLPAGCAALRTTAASAAPPARRARALAAAAPGLLAMAGSA